MPIDVIKPTIFRNEKRISAFFTLKNEAKFNSQRRIKGLNLGFNTDEAPEIIKANRQQLVEKFNFDPNWLAFANQVHSNRVKVVQNGGTFAETDGLITQIPGLALAIQVADCAAVLITDEELRIIAALHAGWRGAVGNIVPIALDKIKKIGGSPTDFKAFISPCISMENFEVGSEVAEQFPDQFVDYENYKKPHINLKSFLQNQLVEGGLLEKNVEVHPGCTVDDEQFYSYRREKGKSGRMMAVIKMEAG